MLQTMPTAWRASAGVSVEDELTRLRKGDMDALGALIERHQTRLYRYLLRLAHDPATAEDIFQHTWIRVAEKIRSYDPKRSFDNWLFTVARNLAFDHMRRYRPERVLMSRCPRASRAWKSLLPTLPGRWKKCSGRSGLPQSLELWKRCR